MTAATYLTLLRTILVPVFAVPAVSYGMSVKSGNPNETLHWWAVGIFFVAAMTDYADGVIARRYNQRTRFGAFLDPFADKLLILTAITADGHTSASKCSPGQNQSAVFRFLWGTVLV